MTGSTLAGLESLPLAVAMRDWPWLFPAIRIVHITGFVTLVGSVLVFDLRALGLSKDIPVSALMRHTMPWILGALLLIVPSGLMMFTARVPSPTSARLSAALSLLLWLGIISCGRLLSNS